VSLKPGLGLQNVSEGLLKFRTPFQEVSSRQRLPKDGNRGYVRVNRQSFLLFSSTSWHHDRPVFSDKPTDALSRIDH